VLDLIESMPDTSPVTVMCEAFPGAPPAGVLNQGMCELTWLGSGDIKPGDSFHWNFTDCWVTDGPDSGQLANGAIDFSGYTRVVDSNNRLVRLGFEPFDQQPGGVVYEGLTITETVEVEAGMFELDASTRVVLDGGLAIVFFEPTR